MDGNSGKSLSYAVKLISEGLCKEALPILQKTVEKHPEVIEGWYNLGLALHECEKLEDAVKAYDEALSIDNMIFEVWFNKGTVLYDLADLKNAKECYEKALEINEEDAEAWNNLGNCHSRLGEGQEAIKAYTRAVAIQPDYAEALYNKANAHFIEGEDKRAIAYGELAMQLNPSLATRINQWIQVSRDRLASFKAQDEHKERQRLRQKFKKDNRGVK